MFDETKKVEIEAVDTLIEKAGKIRKYLSEDNWEAIPELDYEKDIKPNLKSMREAFPKKQIEILEKYKDLEGKHNAEYIEETHRLEDRIQLIDSLCLGALSRDYLLGLKK